MSEDDIDGEAPKNSERLFRQLKTWVKKDREHSAKWRDDAREDFAFAAGEQYTDKELEHLKSQLRPIITFNRIDPLIRAVTGAEITARQEVKFIPREMGDVKANDVYTSAAIWFRDQCDAEDEESDMFLDSAICGMGWTETRLDYDEDPEGMPLIDRIDPLCMVWDHSAMKRNLADARRVSRIKKMTLAEAKELFPDAEREDFGGNWIDLSIDGEVKNQDEEDKYLGDNSDTVRRDEDYVTIVETQWWEKKPYWFAVDPMTGQQMEIDKATNDRLSKRFKAMGQEFQSVRMMKKIFKRAFYSNKLLEVGEPPCGGHFSYQCTTAFRDNNKGIFYGLVRAMKDPQRWANKWMSQILHIMNSSAKGGVMMEKGAVEDVASFERSYARSDAVTYVENGALSNGKVMPKPSSNMPVGFFQMMEFAVSSVRDVTGVNLEMLGMREATQAASLEYQRRQASMTILASLFDGLRRYRKTQGRVMLHIITEYLSDGRLIKIVGDEGAQYVPLIKQSSTKYDVIVDEAPSTPNQKEMVWSFIGPMYMSLPPQVQAVLIDYAPLPETVIEKLKQAMGEVQKGMAESGAKQAQMLEAQAANEVQASQAKIAVDQAKAELEKIKLLTERERMNIDVEKLALDSRKIDIEEGKVSADINQEWAKIDIQRQEAQASMFGELASAIQGMASEQRANREMAMRPKKVTTPDGRQYTMSGA